MKDTVTFLLELLAIVGMVLLIVAMVVIISILVWALLKTAYDGLRKKFKSPKQEAEEWAKDNPSITDVYDSKGDPRKEWGFLQLSAADEMVMSSMGNTAKFDYVTNKINIFRGSATPIKVYVEHGPIVGRERRIKWEEI